MRISEEIKQEVRGLIAEGSKILAIKKVREKFGLSLEDAKQLVDLIEDDIIQDEIKASAKVVSHGKNSSSYIIGSIFTLIGLVLLGVAVYVFMHNQAITSKSVTAIGVVISNPAQPIFEYEYQGIKYNYYSSVSSNPPVYEIGEEVTLYINPQQPHEVLIDTFMERWFVIVLLGGMGLLFGGIGFLVMIFMKTSIKNA